MIVTQEPAQNTYFDEDINSTTGQCAVTSACVVYDITITSDSGAVGNVSIFDGTVQADMTLANKKIDIRIGAAGASQQHVTFPRGKKFNNGVYVKANVASLDMAMTYD